MAITAAITLSSATSTAPGIITATVTITNNNSTDANTLDVEPIIVPSGLNQRTVAAALEKPALGPGTTIRVAASGGTLALPFRVQVYSPFSGAGLANPTSQVYTIGANITTNASGSDALVAASTSNLTVSSPSH